MTDNDRQLLTLLRERCYQEGDFVLASGARSKFYFDAKMLFMSSDGAGLIGEAIYQKTKDLDIKAIGGLEIGSIPLTTAAVIAYHQHGQTMEGFIVRQQPKTHGTKKLIEGKVRTGWRVAIVDDVATKGGSIMKAVEEVKRAECVPVVITVLMDRREGAADLFRENGIPFEPIFTIQDMQSK